MSLHFQHQRTAGVSRSRVREKTKGMADRICQEEWFPGIRHQYAAEQRTDNCLKRELWLPASKLCSRLFLGSNGSCSCHGARPIEVANSLPSLRQTFANATCKAMSFLPCRLALTTGPLTGIPRPRTGQTSADLTNFRPITNQHGGWRVDQPLLTKCPISG
jgi:hypothetical protein